MDVSQNEQEDNHYWKYREVVFGMLGYFSAVFAFLFLLFTKWSVNSQIITLSDYVYRDSAAAIDLVKSCTFVEEKDFEKSWERVEKLFDHMKNQEKSTPELTTPELLQLTLDMHE